MVVATLTVQACGDDGGLTLPHQAVATPNSGIFTISATPTSVLQGGVAQSTIDIVRTGGFTGNVALAVTRLPAGFTASITPSVVAGSIATLVVSADPAVDTGTIVVMITGTSAGHPDHTTSATITIVRLSDAEPNVALDYSACAAGDKPIWFAVQDGSGPWRQVLPSGDVYRFAVASGKGGVAAVYERWPKTVYVSFLTHSEMTTLPVGGPCGPPRKTLSGTLGGLAADDVAYVGMGGGLTDPEGGPASPSFTLTGVKDGNQDLVAFRSTPGGANDRMIIRRDQNIGNNGSIAVIDFSSQESFAPNSAELSVTGNGSVHVSEFMTYLTGAECSAASIYDHANAGAGSIMRGVPTERQRPTDFHQVTVYAQNVPSYRAASESFHTMADRVVEYPAALPHPAIVTLPGGPKRIRAAITLPAEYQRSLWVAFFEPREASGWMIASSAWRGGQEASLTFPDLSQVTGWRTSFLPSSTASVRWFMAAFGANAAAESGACAEGARFVTAYMNGQE
jgi:hypothetical protein